MKRYIHSAYAMVGFLCACTATSRASIPIPIHTLGPISLDRLRVDNPAVLPLSGQWKFELTHGYMAEDGYHSASSGPVTASSSQQGHSPLDALRANDPDARWCASNENMPQYWQADLGGGATLADARITWEFRDTLYHYRLEVSLDGKVWKPLLDRMDGPTGPSDAPTFQPTHCRYARITVLSARRNGGPAWASIRHVELKLLANGALQKWTPPPPVAESPATRDQFAAKGLDDTSWSAINTPWNWEMAGFSSPTYDGPDDAVGLYRRVVTVPQIFEGKHVVWHFEGVWDSAEIFINGKRAGYHESGFTAFDLDVTGLVQPGKPNLLAVRVCKTTPSFDLDTGDYWSLGGIYRDTYLVAVNPTHVASVKIDTPLSPDYKTATLKVAIGLHASTADPVTVHCDLYLASAPAAQLATFETKWTGGKPGDALLDLSKEVGAVKLWSAEKPNLYYLVTTISVGGKAVERVEERFGFRQVEIKDGVVVWNGVPIKCTGSCRHEEWAALGHALNEKAWRTDLTLMKGCNINAIRTSHYNHAGRFIELCDEVGMYVLDEVPACWCNLSDPKLRGAFIQRTKETLDRDQNRACVLAWSLANESGYGPNAAAMLDFVKEHDPGRPAFVSQCGPWNNPKIDFQDVHYPSIEDVKRMAAEPLRKKTPLVMTEQPHIFYVKDGLDYDYGEKDFWGQALSANWSVVWPNDSILGSFIWEWQDQGIADKYPGGADQRDANGLRGNNVKGIVDGYRNVKPEYWNVKMVYSPVTIAVREVAAQGNVIQVPIQNRYSFTDLSELKCQWQALSGSTVLATGVQLVTCAPRSSVTAAFPLDSGMDTLRLEFIHPDGRSIYASRIHLAGAALLPSAPAADRDRDFHETQAGADVKVAWLDSGSATFKNGALGALHFNGTELLRGPIQLDLGEGRKNHGDHGAADFIGSAVSPVLGLADVQISRDEANPVITTVQSVSLREKAEPIARLEIRYEPHGNAEVAVSWTLNWTGAPANLWEVGLRLPLGQGVEQLSWNRDGIWSEYPVDHIGANFGTAKPADLTFRTTKRDVRWYAVSAKQAGLCALPASDPLHARCVRGSDGVELFLLSAVAPPFDFSTNLLPDKLIKVRKDTALKGSFVLRPFKQ